MAITAKIGKRKTWTVKVGAYNGGTKDHSKLFNRDADNQHPMSAISGLKTFAENTNTHMNSKENPHGVTATQVGARPDTWMPTASDVGAAPAGYGLGADGRIVNDCNFATANGWYIPSADAENRPGNWGGWMFVASRYGTMVVQDFYAAVTPIRHYWRYGINGNWSEWEAQNPPMTVGVEYRTTELWNGKPVYKQTISLGKLPESTTKFENLLIADEVVDFSFTTTDNTSEKFIHNNKVTALGRAWSSQYIYATIELNSVLSQYYGYLTISYTKL
jgi:hypothetical protein